MEMNGPQHGYQTGYQNAQQAALRNQYVGGGGPQMPGLINPNQQPGMVGTQGYMGVVGMPPQGNPQAQQMQQQQLQMQQMQQQMQQQQMQQQQHQQQQQQQVGGGGGGQQQAPQNRSSEFNTASLCRYGQETVQDIVSRTQEVISTLKLLQPPNGTSQGQNLSNEKKVKVQDQLKQIKNLFKRLRLIYGKCNESCQLQGMEYMHIESLIPVKDESTIKPEERKTSEQYRLVVDESKGIIEQVILKNRQLKEIIDQLRKLIWEINTMLAIRRS